MALLRLSKKWRDANLYRSFPPTSHLHRPFPSVPTISTVRCSAVHPTPTAADDPPPVAKSITPFAPATVANLGPSFDVLGCAVDRLGDEVTARVDPAVAPGALSISSISGSDKLSLDPARNCAGIAAAAVMRKLAVRSFGLSLTLHKGLPLGSGLGSSAASAAAAAVAVNGISSEPLPESDLVLAGLESEARVSGFHADNIAPATLGGFVLVRSYDPLQLLPLGVPAGEGARVCAGLARVRGADEEDAGGAAGGGGDEGSRRELQSGGGAGEGDHRRGRGAAGVGHVVGCGGGAAADRANPGDGGGEGGGVGRRGVRVHYQWGRADGGGGD